MGTGVVGGPQQVLHELGAVLLRVQLQAAQLAGRACQPGEAQPQRAGGLRREAARQRLRLLLLQQRQVHRAPRQRQALQPVRLVPPRHDRVRDEAGAEERLRRLEVQVLAGAAWLQLRERRHLRRAPSVAVQLHGEVQRALHRCVAVLVVPVSGSSRIKSGPQAG